MRRLRDWWRRWCGVRVTGPEDNRAVLGWFFRGPERRRKDKGFSAGFARGAKQPRTVDHFPRLPAHRDLPWARRGEGPHAPIYLLATDERQAEQLRRAFPGISVEVNPPL
jgi:hypothetical protein